MLARVSANARVRALSNTVGHKEMWDKVGDE